MLLDLWLSLVGVRFPKSGAETADLRDEQECGCRPTVRRNSSSVEPAGRPSFSHRLDARKWQKKTSCKGLPRPGGAPRTLRYDRPSASSTTLPKEGLCSNDLPRGLAR